MRKLTVATSGVFALALGVIATPGCGSSFSDVCTAAIKCEGGNDADANACADAADAVETVAADYGCSDAFDKYANCVDASGTCKSKHFDLSACDKLGSSLGSCIDAASGGHGVNSVVNF